MGESLVNSIVKLYQKAATTLPLDIETKLRNSGKNENGTAKQVLKDIIKNIEIAKGSKRPLCQDTGIPIFFVHYSKRYSQRELKRAIKKATKKATGIIPLRPNAVDSLTGENSGNNLGKDFPEIFFEEWDKDFLKITLLLKGGGSENMAKLYKLPDENLDAQRDLNGIRKCILDAVCQAQGKWCPPGIIGVAIGGSRDAVTKESKRQLLRNIDDINTNPQLKKLEISLLKEINSLGIGPNGLGGKTTALSLKIASLHRHPASFFVDVSFLCWAARKASLIYKKGEVKLF